MRAVLKRVTHLVLVLWLVSLATFLLLELVPGDPATAVLGTSGTPDQYAQVRAQLGLDLPLHERYLSWLGGALQGDFGESLTPPHQDVSAALAARLPVTFQIAACGLLLALVISVPTAVWAAHRQGRIFDRWSSSGVFAVMSLPTFLIGIFLIQGFVFHPQAMQTVALLVAVGVTTGAGWTARRRATRGDSPWSLVLVAVLAAVLVLLLIVAWPTFPRQGFSRLGADGGLAENLRHIALPVLTVALGELALFTRVLRSEMIQTLDTGFVEAARARGLPTHRILLGEALRPASFSLVTVAGLSLGSLMGGTLIVEVLFNLPGMGRLLVEAIESNDYVTVQAGVLVLAAIYVLLNAAVDLLYRILDPRIRHAEQ